MSVTVPPHLKAGDQMVVQTPDSKQYVINVPHGVGPGGQFHIRHDFARGQFHIILLDQARSKAQKARTLAASKAQVSSSSSTTPPAHLTPPSPTTSHVPHAPPHTSLSGVEAGGE